MRKLLMMSAALAAGMLSLSGATSQAAQPTQQMAAKSMKVTGMVTAANLNKQQITVDGQTFQMAMGGGETVWPQVGAGVTLYYQNRNGQKTVTRIGQAQSQNQMTAAAGQQMAANETYQAGSLGG
jgi:hypothetical protein